MAKTKLWKKGNTTATGMYVRVCMHQIGIDTITSSREETYKQKKIKSVQHRAAAATQL